MAVEIIPFPAAAGPLYPQAPNAEVKFYGFALQAIGGDVQINLRDGDAGTPYPIHLLDGESRGDPAPAPDGIRFANGIFIEVDHPELVSGMLLVRTGNQTG